MCVNHFGLWCRVQVDDHNIHPLVAHLSMEQSESNFVQSAGEGCHIARKKGDDDEDWVVEWETVDPEEFLGTEVPDISMDPDEKLLSLCNVDTHSYKVAYITISGTPLVDRYGKRLKQGVTSSSDAAGGMLPCTTLIVLCPPHMICHLCYIEDLSLLKIDSDVQRWNRHPDPADTATQALTFPLDGSFLCTQSENATLTHFFSGNYHALDFDCPSGTPFLAVGNGVVHAVQTDHSNVTGIGVSNMFQWNSLMLELDKPDEQHVVDTSSECVNPEEHVLRDTEPLYVEYVHIDKSFVAVGDRVERGQVLGTTGAAGFCPTPHLHISAFRTSDDKEPTCRVYFRAKDDGHLFLPRAGLTYDGNGKVE